jgi:hypothetical protein
VKTALNRATTAQQQTIMKTLDDIKLDMSELYDSVKNGDTELKTAAELANIAGKYLKAEQLDLARQIFLRQIAPAKVAGRVRELAHKE